jgi:endo-1,4-beta-D-glucanase Y
VPVLAVSTAGCDRSGTPKWRRDFLARGWDAYKHTYIHPDGYVLDPSRTGGETTSEGQGYALLRAVWMRDEPTFSSVFRWTEDHLRRADGLYSWQWTPARGGQVVDANSASDADQEIAFALVLGASAFDKPVLRERAREVLRAIRTHERVTTDEGWFPAAGNWAVEERIVNLSYFIPYAYPDFTRVDPEGQWDRVIDTGYALLASALRVPGVRLLPDFMVMTNRGAAAALPERASLSRNFSSDAMRVYWRVAVDCLLNRRIQACADPLGARRLTELLARDGALFTRYGVDGSPLERTESMSFYSAAVPYLLLYAPATGRAIEADRLSEEAVGRMMAARDRYYDANWVWFGIAATDGFLSERMTSPGR